MGSVDDSYGNALAETIIGLYKTEVITAVVRGGMSIPSSMRPWNGSAGFNHCRLLEPIGNVPPAELELAYYRQQNEWALAV